MGVRNELLGGTDWGREGLSTPDFNDTFDAVVRNIKLIDSIYTGSDFNSSRSATTTGSDSSDHTIQISSSELENVGYLEITVNFNATAVAKDLNGARGNANCTFKIERQETGSGAGFTNVLANQTICGPLTTAGYPDQDSQRSNGCFRVIVSLTDDERTNGIDIKFTSVSSTNVVVGAPSINASFSNIQTWFKGLV